MPCSHLSSCIQASYSIPVLQMKMRLRAAKELFRLLKRVRVCARVLECAWVCFHIT